MTTDQRKRLAKQPITWTGDLMDDCSAKWAGLLLRAEWMDEDYWWWSVYDMQKGEITIEDSTEHDQRFIGGDITRKKAESIAINYITAITSEATAKYLIAETFKITKRGLALTGYITEGNVSIGDIIEFPASSILRLRKIIGIEDIRNVYKPTINTGLLLQCNSDFEIDELAKWQPNNIIATIYKSAQG